MNYVATTYIVHTSYKTVVSDRYTFDGCLCITILRGFMGYSFAYNFGYPIKYTNPIFRSFFCYQIKQEKNPTPRS